MTVLPEATRLPSGLYVPAPTAGLYVPPTYRPKTRPKAVDLFAGCGGFSLGFLQAGFEVVAALESDTDAAIAYMVNLGAYPINVVFATPEDRDRLEHALQTLLKRQLKKSKGKDPVEIARMLTSGSHRNPEYPGVSHFFFGDIRQFEPEQILRVIGIERGQLDCVLGSPPCQGFSKAGRRQVMDPRNSLVFDFARMVTGLHPKTFVMENVPEMATMVTPEGIPVVDAFCRILEDGGFGTYDAMRQYLSGSVGAKGLIRGAGRGRRKGHGVDEENEVDEEAGAVCQPALL